MEYGEKVGQKELTEWELQQEIQNRIKLGKAIRQARKAKKLTTVELGNLVNVSANYVSLVERGEKSCSDGFIREVSRTLGLDEDELFSIAGRVSLRVKETIETHSGLQSLISDISKANLNSDQMDELVDLLKQTFEQYKQNKNIN